MGIDIVHTLFCIKEMATEGHSPVLFHCSDDYNYFCKYRIGIQQDEINCLAFETIANRLLNYLNIPTPEIALVKISPQTLDRKIILKNHKMKDDMIVFGSKSIHPSLVLTDLAICKDKHEFNKIANPEDLIKIAIFDLWVENVDRGRPMQPVGFNYNLLIAEEDQKEKIVAFDHAFIFGGSKAIGGFISGAPIISSNKLHKTPYFKSVIKHFSPEEYTYIIDNFLSLLHHDYIKIISQTVDEISEYWELLPNLAERASAFLMTKKRIEEIESIIKSSRS